MIKLTRLSVLFFLTICALDVSASGWSQSAKVLKLTASTQQSFVVRLALDKNSCKSKDTFYMDYTVPAAELIYQSLLEALINNRNVELHTNGVCELNGYEGFSALRLSAK